MASNSSSDTDDLLGTDPIELSQMITQDYIPDVLTAAFTESPVALAILREYCFISHAMNNLRRELGRGRAERTSLFNALMGSRNFQHTMFPILTEFRRRQQETALPPYPQPLSSSSSTNNSPHSSELNSESPRSIEIQSENHSLSEPLSLIVDSSSSYHTAVLDEPGSSTNPIDVDAIEIPQEAPQNVQFVTTTGTTPHTDSVRAHRDTPHPNEGTLVRARTLPSLLVCSTCIRTGHTRNDCIYEGPLICDYCNRPGHARRSCPTLAKDIARYNANLRHCEFCGQSGHSQEECWAFLFPDRL
jgi:hypothetical protein